VNTAYAARPMPQAEAAALEARFGLRLTARLSEANQALPHDISERLRVARLQALTRVPAKVATKQAQTASALVITHVGSGAMAARLLGDGQAPWWVRWGSLVPMVALVAGVIFIHEWNYREQITTAATIDAALLSDPLPPSAYTDPGFNEFLRTPDAEALDNPEPSAQ